MGLCRGLQSGSPGELGLAGAGPFPLFSLVCDCAGSPFRVRGLRRLVGGGGGLAFEHGDGLLDDRGELFEVLDEGDEARVDP